MYMTIKTSSCNYFSLTSNNFSSRPNYYIDVILSIRVPCLAKFTYFTIFNPNIGFKNTFNINKDFSKYFAPKGSVSIDGVSLTVNDVSNNFFSVNIIPHTWLNTSFKNYVVGSSVNVEFDILIRYLESLNANK